MNKESNLFSSEGNNPELTPREKNLVVSSWSLVSKDLKGNGVELFLMFFKDFPEYQSLFPFRDVPYEELGTSSKLKSHAVTVMYTIGSIIDNLDDLEVLNNLLQKNGEAHGKRGITAHHYEVLKPTVIKLLRKGLGSDFTKETEDAWYKTLTVAFDVIKKAL